MFNARAARKWALIPSPLYTTHKTCLDQQAREQKRRGQWNAFVSADRKRSKGWCTRQTLEKMKRTRFSRESQGNKAKRQRRRCVYRVLTVTGKSTTNICAPAPTQQIPQCLRRAPLLVVVLALEILSSLACAKASNFCASQSPTTRTDAKTSLSLQNLRLPGRACLATSHQALGLSFRGPWHSFGDNPGKRQSGGCPHCLECDQILHAILDAMALRC
jgi:hypothetical protein